MAALDLKSLVREVPDFPKPGIGFKDITPLLVDPAALRQSVGELADWSAEREPDLIGHGARVLIHDDVLATGGTVEAIAGLVEQLGGEVCGACFIIELGFLKGRDRLSRYDLFSLLEY